MLDNCVKLCAVKQLQSETLCIQRESITDGILELISQLRIQKLVMGAGKNNKKWRIKVPNSRKSNYVLQCAPNFCHIWFVCKDRLIYTRNGMMPLDLTLEENQSNRFSDSESFYSPTAESVDSSSPLAQSNVNDLSPASKLEALEEPETSRQEDSEESETKKTYYKEALEEPESSRQEASEESETKKTYYKVKATVEKLTHVTTDLKNMQIGLYEVSKMLPQADVEFSSLERQIKDRNLSGDDLEEELLLTETLQKYMKQYDEVKLECDNAVEAVEVLKEQVSQESSSLNDQKFSCEFSQLDLQEATKCFDPSLIIRKGSSASVYKGYLYHTELAIKIYNHSLQCIAEFEQEVDVLSKLRHPNLVTLIGSCPDSLALIYEYLPNGNLEDQLACKDNTISIPWQTRIRIVTELCSVLNFLHCTRPCSIIHGDLTLKTVLLDANFRCKLSGFGFCHIISTVTTEELNSNEVGHLSLKSDVYSFGMILLRLLTGKPASNIVQEVQHALDNDLLHDMLDRTAGDWPIIRAKQLAYIALKCCDVKAEDRPDLRSEVWSVLKPVVTPSELLSGPLQLPSEDQVPPHFICPILQEIMQDPHFAADGFTYEGHAVRGWFEGGHDTSPMTNLKIRRRLTPNHALRSAIQDWLQQHRHQ